MAETRFTPSYDNKIYQKFSKKTIQNKIKNKESFLKDNDMPFDKKVPLICMTYPLTDSNNVQMIQDIMNGILEQPVQLVLMGIGTEKYQKFFTQLAEKNPDKITITENDEDIKRNIYAAADIMLVPADNEECLLEAEQAMRYGVIPITPEAGFAQDYDPIQESGNAFVYKKTSPWSLFAVLIRALENFRFPYDWKNIQISSME